MTTGASDRSNSACFDSFHSAANRSGAPTKSLSPSILRGSVGSNQVLKVCSGNSCRARSSSRVQASCAVRVTNFRRCGKLRGREAMRDVDKPQRRLLALIYVMITNRFTPFEFENLSQAVFKHVGAIHG